MILNHRGELCVWCDPDLGCNQTQIYCRNTTLTLARLFIADDGRKSTYAHVKTDTVQCGAVVTTIKRHKSEEELKVTETIYRFDEWATSRQKFSLKLVIEF